MSRALLTILALLAAFIIGISTASYTLLHWLEIAGQRSGPWQRLSSIGLPDTDPYTRAVEHISSALPIGSAEGQIYQASVDSDGKSLSGACTYTVTGEIPAARLFTLRAETTGGQFIRAEKPLQSALHSDQLLFNGTTYKISIGAKTQPDNWLALQVSGPFRLVLSYYNAAVINDDTGNSTRFPRIIKGNCKNV